ncbi:response regulator transcription factor [Paenibacillus amylolyticus]|uniref:response regulator transcription factor n=1 Tax=Paenibacillus TaxID=44249 RepID=UPI00249C4A71|nr:response regulator transcription factor [Paenibacillus amylolyticus]WFA84336.1 response regulator transcription factor [Paenibacillus amylolyticus]
MYRIWIVEDDPNLASLLQACLEKYNLTAQYADDFEDIMAQFQHYKPHLVLLDVNLPSYDGYYWCRQIRKVSTCPIIFISARSGDMDQVMALEYGADDYMTKPFHHELVIAKVRSQLRRVYGEYAGDAREKMVEQGGLALYPDRLELKWRGATVALARKEADLLDLLLLRYPLVVTREALLDRLWDDQQFVDENTLNVNIARARKKLQEIAVAGSIETVRGSGYKLVLETDELGEPK